MQYLLDVYLWMSLIIVLSIFILMFVCSGIKVLKEWERVAILRLGKFYAIRGPGIIWKTPILDKIALKVSLRVQSTDISTSSWKGIVNWRIVDVEKYLFSLQDHERTVHTTIHHQVSKVIEDSTTDAAFTDSEELNYLVQIALEPIFSDWGLKVVSVDLRTNMG